MLVIAAPIRTGAINISESNIGRIVNSEVRV
jgi:hypothetical protein